MNTTPYANSLFEQPWWLDIVAPAHWTEIFVRDENDTVIARLPYVFSTKKIFVPKCTQNIGLWISPEYKNNYGKQKLIINELFAQLSTFKKIDISLHPDNAYILPFRWLGFSLVPAFTYRIENLSDIDSLFGTFNKTAKKNIKNARNKLTLKYDTNIMHLLSLLDKTFSAQNRKNPMDKALITAIVSYCDAHNAGHYAEAVDNAGNVHSCAYFVYDKSCCYYLFGATDSTFRSSGAQSLVIWDGIQFASGHSEAFDFEGSMVEGIENFFRQFGGKCVPYYRIWKGSLFDDVAECVKPRIKRLLGYKI